MYYNSNWQYTNDTKIYSNNVATTKTTSNSYDLDSHFVLIFQGILGYKVKDIKANAFKKIANFNQKQQMSKQMIMFINHCATLIQSKFRGYQQRKYYKLFKPILLRFKQLLIAVVSGWRVRNIMKTNRIGKKCQKIKQQNNKQRFRDARIIKRQLIQDINFLQSKGNWLTYHQESKKRKQKTKVTNIKIALGLRSSVNTSKEKQNSKMQLKKKQQKSKIKNQQVSNLNTERKTHYNQHQQAPLKATGFYNIISQQSLNSQIVSKPTPKANIKRKTNLQNKSKSKTKDKQKKQNQNTNKQCQAKIVSNIKQKQKQTNKKQNENTIKKQQLNTSNLTINLPIQTVVFEEQNFIPTKTIKLSRIKQHMSNTQSKVQSPQNELKQNTQKIKKINRGIRVTLSSNQIQSQQKSKPIQANEIKEKDQLAEIVSVYNNAYMNKSKQITSMMNAMKTQRKFVS